jgi:hypothetical protein
MSHGYAYRCEHCMKTDINETGIVAQPRPPRGWLVVAASGEDQIIKERVACSTTCLVAMRALLEDDGAWS